MDRRLSGSQSRFWRCGGHDKFRARGEIETQSVKTVAVTTLTELPLLILSVLYSEYTVRIPNLARLQPRRIVVFLHLTDCQIFILDTSDTCEVVVDRL
jgi:hypothetical protein